MRFLRLRTTPNDSFNPPSSSNGRYDTDYSTPRDSETPSIDSYIIALLVVLVGLYIIMLLWKQHRNFVRLQWLQKVENNRNVHFCHKETWHGLLLRDAPNFVRKDKEIVMAASKSSFSFALQYAKPVIRQNKIFVLHILKESGCGLALQFASPALQNDHQLVVTAYKSIFKSIERGRDRDFVLHIIQLQGGSECGYMLRFVAPELQNDRQVVMAASKNSENGSAFQFASPELKQDEDFVLQVIKQTNGGALEFAAPNVQGKKRIVLAAVRLKPDAIKYAGVVLKRDPDVLIAAGLFDEDHNDRDERGGKQHPQQEQQDGLFKLQDFKKITFSTRFSLNESGISQATDFTSLFKKSKYFQEGNFVLYSPNAFDKKTCDPK